MNAVKVGLSSRVAVVVSYLVMLVVNGLAGSSTVIGGQNTAQVSDANPSLFTPAGFTFAIWGVIYLLLAGYVLRVVGILKPAAPHLDEASAARLRMLFSVSSLVNAAWIFAWQYEVFALTLVLMAALLVTLIAAHRASRQPGVSLGEAVTTQWPFSVYVGWISVATVANVATALVAWDWGRFGLSEVFWMVLIAIVATGIALAFGLGQRDVPYLLVFVWAYIGILGRHLSDGSMGLKGEYPTVITTMGVLLGAIVVAAAYVLFTSIRSRSSSTSARTA